MRSKRKVVVQLVESGGIHNHRLVEYFAKKFDERKIENEKISNGL